MFDLIIKFLQQFIERLTPGHFEGMFLYACGALTITVVQIYFRKDVVDGLKGENKMWEAPEWLVYISGWIFPHMILADGFLQVQFSTNAWLLMGGLILFGLTGRWGLEWLLSLKNGTPSPSSQDQNNPK